MPTWPVSNTHEHQGNGGSRMLSDPQTRTPDTVVRPASPLQVPRNRGLAEDTLTRMFWNRIEHSPDTVAHLVKRVGRWQPLTWTVVGAAAFLVASHPYRVGCPSPTPAMHSATACRALHHWRVMRRSVVCIRCFLLPPKPAKPCGFVAQGTTEGWPVRCA